MLPGVGSVSPPPSLGWVLGCCSSHRDPRGWGGCTFPPPRCTPSSWSGSDVRGGLRAPQARPGGAVRGSLLLRRPPRDALGTPPSPLPLSPRAVRGVPVVPLHSLPPSRAASCLWIGGSFVRFHSSSGVRGDPPNPPPHCGDPALAEVASARVCVLPRWPGMEAGGTPRLC